MVNFSLCNRNFKKLLTSPFNGKMLARISVLSCTKLIVSYSIIKNFKKISSRSIYRFDIQQKLFFFFFSRYPTNFTLSTTLSCFDIVDKVFSGVTHLKCVNNIKFLYKHIIKQHKTISNRHANVEPRITIRSNFTVLIFFSFYPRHLGHHQS